MVANPALPREFPFDRRQFDQIAGLAHRLAGISLSDAKVDMVYARLARRLRELGLSDFASYCDLLNGPDGTEEQTRMVNCLTTNLTRFFRESVHFDHLADTVLAPLSRPDGNVGASTSGTRRRLRLWSAGCSTGEEAYSIAMTLLDRLPESAGWDTRILATDIDTEVLQQASRGIFAAESRAGIPVGLQNRFIQTLPDGTFAATAALRRLIAFKPLNLLEMWPMRGPFDAIFCRNVMIYFDRESRMQIVDRFLRMLSPGGFLYVGHSESLHGLNDQLITVAPTIYQRPP